MSFTEYLKQNRKGVAGLDLALSVITMIFVIGLLIMIFALMSGELQDATDDDTAIKVINDTGASLAGAVDWFPIVIVITFMVVLILLTVIIIRSIRGSGLMDGGSGGQEGSA